MQLQMTAREVEELISRGFDAKRQLLHIETLEPGFVRTRVPFHRSMVRPGNVISGPALFAAADVAMYALVLAHVGPRLMAVTSQLNIHFVNLGKAADVYSDARLLKLGRKLALMEVRLFCGDDPTLVALVTGSYVIPGGSTSVP